jgi:hypothetical protein
MYALFACWRCEFWHSRQFTPCRKLCSLKPDCYFKPSQNIGECICSLEQTMILHCYLVASWFQRLVWTRSSYRSMFVFRYQVGPAFVFCCECTLGARDSEQRCFRSNEFVLPLFFRPASKSWKKNWNKRKMRDPRYEHLYLLIKSA